MDLDTLTSFTLPRQMEESDPYRALYIHLPFCVKRCSYCDFHTAALSNHSERGSALMKDYGEQISLALMRATRAHLLDEISTIYIGGGTPTHAARELTSIMYTLSLMKVLTDDMEISFEANPESVTERIIADMWALGANRVSLGVQSFQDDELRGLGRVHSASDALRAIDTIQSRFTNVSIDLMCGIPYQTRESFRSSLETAISTGITHISIYPLTIEEHTPFAREVACGRMALPDDDVQADMMEDAFTILTQAGFKHYEVASYALDGYACKHNEAYWNAIPYLGVGAGATSMQQGSWGRVRHTSGKLDDRLTYTERLCEDAMLGMRQARGISLDLVHALKAEQLPVDEVLTRLIQTGLVEKKSDRFCPTHRGWLLGNEIFSAFLGLAS